MLKPNSIRILGMAAAIVALTGSGAANAESMTVTRNVSTQGLDLASSGDQAKLRQLINKATRRVCSEATGGFNAGDADFRDCVREAFAGAWAQAETKIAAAKSRAFFASATPK